MKCVDEWPPALFDADELGIDPEDERDAFFNLESSTHREPVGIQSCERVAVRASAQLLHERRLRQCARAFNRR